MITQERLKELLHYNPDTGLFTRRKGIPGHSSGCVVGGLNQGGYIGIKLDYKTYLAHRLVFVYTQGNIEDFDQVDHINRNRSDNRLINLRIVSHSENKKNRALEVKNTSGFCGVRFVARDSRWLARIQVDKKHIHLGYFETLIDAVAARIRANKKHGFHENHGIALDGEWLRKKAEEL